MEPEKIAIYVPDEDAKKFLKFQEHYDLFTLLLESGVFQQKNAAIILNFDEHGILQAIDREDCLFNARFDKKSY